MLPGVAPVAMQQGRYAAQARARPPARPRAARRSSYRDKGNLATIGRAARGRRPHGSALSGFPAWIDLAGRPPLLPVGFQNRLLVLIRWAFSFVTRGRGARLITDQTAASESEARSEPPPLEEAA